MFRFNIESLHHQIEEKKRQILAGVTEGLGNASSDMENLMKVHMDRSVYGVYDPIEYKRHRDEGGLRGAVSSEVKQASLFIYIDPDKLIDNTGTTEHGRMTRHQNYPYSFRVFWGHQVYSYDFPPESGFAAFLSPRDWITPMKNELMRNTAELGILKRHLISAIQKKVGGG